MSEFEKNGFVVIENVLCEQTLELLSKQFKMVEDCHYFINKIDKKNTEFFQDPQVPFSFPWYSLYCFESIMLMMQPILEDVIGKKLFPCYSYARIMHKGAKMDRHIDRPSCQYSATICISEDSNFPYPIFMENYDGKIFEIFLKPGGMIVYNGTELHHWREKYLGDEHIQCFIHFVDSNGVYKDEKYDGRPMLGLSKDYC